MKPIKTFVINLEERSERKISVLSEFYGREEFDLKLVKAIKDEIGAWGLWLTIRAIVKDAQEQGEQYILICEDDHQFTSAYEKSVLFDQISEMLIVGAEILLGGVSWFDMILPVSKKYFWVKKFNGMQFSIIFSNFFEKILSLDYKKGDDVDIVFSMISTRSFVCYPYLSIQKEFGYSDVTSRNAGKGYVTKLFSSRMELLDKVYRIASYYNKV